MITATHEIMNTWKENPDIPDMRTAAYVVAINKVATSYAELGYFSLINLFILLTKLPLYRAFHLTLPRRPGSDQLTACAG
jgi:hypothetical protein